MVRIHSGQRRRLCALFRLIVCWCEIIAAVIIRQRSDKRRLDPRQLLRRQRTRLCLNGSGLDNHRHGYGGRHAAFRLAAFTHQRTRRADAPLRLIHFQQHGKGTVCREIKRLGTATELHAAAAFNGSDNRPRLRIGQRPLIVISLCQFTQRAIVDPERQRINLL